jgi:hypothetical protein
MPKRAAPGNRQRLEAALSCELRVALEQARELLNIHDWRVSPLAAPFQQCAVVLAAARLVAAGESSEKDALDAAAISLGISPDTVRSRSRRWPRDSRSLCTPTAEQPPDTLGQEDDETPVPEPS